MTDDTQLRCLTEFLCKVSQDSRSINRLYSHRARKVCGRTRGQPGVLVAPVAGGRGSGGVPGREGWRVKSFDRSFPSPEPQLGKGPALTQHARAPKPSCSGPPSSPAASVSLTTRAWAWPVPWSPTGLLMSRPGWHTSRLVGEQLCSPSMMASMALPHGLVARLRGRQGPSLSPAAREKGSAPVAAPCCPQPRPCQESGSHLKCAAPA